MTRKCNPFCFRFGIYARGLLLYVGWRDEEQIHGCPIHIDIKDGKIWIEQDFTEEGLANQLVELGVPKTDIVLGFRVPYVRQFTSSTLRSSVYWVCSSLKSLERSLVEW